MWNVGMCKLWKICGRWQYSDHHTPATLPSWTFVVFLNMTCYLGGRGDVTNEATRVHQLLSSESESELHMTTKHEQYNVGATTYIFIIVIRVACDSHKSGLLRLNETVPNTKFM